MKYYDENTDMGEGIGKFAKTAEAQLEKSSSSIAFSPSNEIARGKEKIEELYINNNEEDNDDDVPPIFVH